ncbi:hypothetical protein ACF0H5_023761 [Mactra antiquata]
MPPRSRKRKASEVVTESDYPATEASNGSNLQIDYNKLAAAIVRQQDRVNCTMNTVPQDEIIVTPRTSNATESSNLPSTSMIVQDTSCHLHQSFGYKYGVPYKSWLTK